MGLYMPPHIFRLTTFRVPPKVEIGPDGKPRLVWVSCSINVDGPFCWARLSSEAEDTEPVDCKIEDSGYSIPASPTWSSQGSPASPDDNPFHGSSLYPLTSGHTSASSGVYASRGATNEKWQGPNDSMLSPLHRQEMSWSPPGGAALSSAHTMRRRDGNVIQSDTWPSLHPQSGRWQGQSHESSSPSNSSGGGLYPERPRIRANQLYDDSQQAVPRRDHESMATNFPLRYPPHSAGTREGALQRLHWHSRDTPDNARDPRRCNTQTQSSFSSSPTLPFSQGYHNTQPTYSSSWTSTDSNLMTTPTLHSIAQSPLSYDGSYSSNSASIPSPDEFTNVDGYRDS